MAAGKDIFRVSVPLAAGVFSAAILFSRMGNASGWRYIAAGTIQTVTVLTLIGIILHRRRIPGSARHPLLWISVFFLLGMHCYSSRSVILPMLSPWGQDVRSGAMASDAEHTLARAREGMARFIEHIPFRDKEDNALVEALVIGDRSRLSQGTKRDFRTAGAAHMLALSGMHLGIIYLVINRLLCLMGNSIPARKARNLIVTAVCGLYTLLCGAGPSLVRAWLFIALNEGASFLNRPQDPRQVFCAALTLHLIFKPENIMDIGFQLSYLAMVGIVFVWPVMREWYRAEGIGRSIWDAATLSISCQFFTAPLTCFHFGNFPEYFLITNLVGSVLMSIVMASSLAAMTVYAAGGDSGTKIICPYCEWPVRAMRNFVHIIAEMSR